MTDEWIASLGSWVVAASWKGTVLILLVAALGWMSRERIPARWRYALWLVVLLRLAVPLGPSSNFSLFNLLQLPAGHLTVAAVRPEPVPEQFDLRRIDS